MERRAVFCVVFNQLTTKRGIATFATIPMMAVGGVLVNNTVVW
ncbi:hypothetical protein [Neobacillus vireti]